MKIVENNPNNPSFIDICIGMVRGIEECDSEAKGMYLRALVINAIIYPLPIKAILSDTGELILSWINEKRTDLDTDEISRITATVNKILGDMSWFNPENRGKNFLLFIPCYFLHWIIQMVNMWIHYYVV